MFEKENKMKETKILKRQKIDEMWLVEEKSGVNSILALHFTAGGNLYRFGYEERLMPPGCHIECYSGALNQEG